MLRAYDTLIIDEAHERSLNIDFLLGYVKRLLPKSRSQSHRDLGTIDAARFASHFGNAPVIEVSGRTYPVEIRSRPLAREDAEEDEVESKTAYWPQWMSSPHGRATFCVFAWERESAMPPRRCASTIQRRRDLPLYARLSFEEQERVFKRAAAPHRAGDECRGDLLTVRASTMCGHGLARLNGTASATRSSNCSRKDLARLGNQRRR